MAKSESVFGECPILLGVMKNEGFLYFNQNEVDDGVSEHVQEKMIRTLVRNVYQYHRQKIYEVLMHHYSDWERPPDPTIIRSVLNAFPYLLTMVNSDFVQGIISCESDGSV